MIPAPGRSGGPEFFRSFLDEAAERLATLSGDAALRERFAQAPIILVAYSGGYNPAAYSLEAGGAADRIRGVVLLDALFGEVDRFAAFLAHDRRPFFVSAFSRSSAPQNDSLKEKLSSSGVPYRNGLDALLIPGGVYFVPALGDAVTHNDFVTRAWTPFPLTAVLGRIGGFEKGGAHAPTRHGKSEAKPVAAPEEEAKDGAER